MRYAIGMVLGAVIFWSGQQTQEWLDRNYPSADKFGTELTVAQGLSHQPVRLIGFDCGDHAMVALAQEEDEFPETGCREIRALDDKEVFF